MAIKRSLASEQELEGPTYFSLWNMKMQRKKEAKISGIQKKTCISCKDFLSVQIYLGIILPDWCIDRRLMQSDIIALLFKILNPPGSLIILVLFLTLVNPSVDDNRALSVVQ